MRARHQSGYLTASESDPHDHRRAAVGRNLGPAYLGMSNVQRCRVMKIDSVRIENFRCFDKATIPLNDYSCLVGPNGAGKSTVLIALNVFLPNRGRCPD